LNNEINNEVKEFPTVTKNLLNELEQKFLNLLKAGMKLVFSKAVFIFFVSLEFTSIAFGM